MDQSGIPPSETDEQRDIRLNKDVAAISYIWITSVVVYAARRDSPFVRFHAKQAVFLFLVSIPVYLIPWFGAYLVFFPIAGMLIGFLNAAQGKKLDVPIVGPIVKGEVKWEDATSIVRSNFKRARDAFMNIFHAPEKPKPTDASAKSQTQATKAEPATSSQPSASPDMHTGEIDSMGSGQASSGQAPVPQQQPEPPSPPLDKNS